jgi:hypothetical protein
MTVRARQQPVDRHRSEDALVHEIRATDREPGEVMSNRISGMRHPPARHRAATLPAHTEMRQGASPTRSRKATPKTAGDPKIATPESPATQNALATRTSSSQELARRTAARMVRLALGEISTRTVVTAQRPLFGQFDRVDRRGGPPGSRPARTTSTSGSSGTLSALWRERLTGWSRPRARDISAYFLLVPSPSISAPSGRPSHGSAWSDQARCR